MVDRRWIIRSNIAQFQERLKNPADEAQRRILEQLLEREKAKLAELDRLEQ